MDKKISMPKSTVLDEAYDGTPIVWFDEDRYEIILVSEIPKIIEKNNLYVRQSGENIEYITPGMKEIAVITPNEFPVGVLLDLLDLNDARKNILLITSKRNHTHKDKQIISQIKSRFKFSECYDLEGVLSSFLVELFEIEYISSRKQNPAEKLEFLKAFESYAIPLLELINNSGVKNRALIAGDTREIHQAWALVWKNLGILADAIPVAIGVCEKENEEYSGGRETQDYNRFIIFRLIEVYEEGTGKKAKCSNNNNITKHASGFSGEFYYFMENVINLLQLKMPAFLTQMESQLKLLNLKMMLPPLGTLGHMAIHVLKERRRKNKCKIE